VRGRDLAQTSHGAILAADAADTASLDRSGYHLALESEALLGFLSYCHVRQDFPGDAIVGCADNLRRASTGAVHQY
jgi:hypothetical protein